MMAPLPTQAAVAYAHADEPWKRANPAGSEGIATILSLFEQISLSEELLRIAGYVSAFTVAINVVVFIVAVN